MTAAEIAAIDGHLAAALPPESLFAVGGRVRDELRAALDGVPVPAKDLDYVAIGLGLEELLARLGALGRAEITGASFPVVKCIVDGVTVDVALPRREQSTGSGHRDFALAAVGPAVTLEEDLARRDFRMNMLARALPTGRLVDPYGGEADIRARRIDIIRPETFVEDPLRMLRAAQFAARFAFTVTPQTRAAMTESAGLAATVSAERLREELVKLLADAPRPSVGLELLRETGVLAVVLPELLEGVGMEQNEWHAYDVYRHTLETLDASPTGDLILRLAALFHDIGKPRTKDGPHFYRHELVGEEMTAAILSRLRFPNDQVATVAKLVREHMYAADPAFSEKTIRRFIRRVEPGNLDRQFALREADIAGSGLPKRGDNNERFEERVLDILSRRPPLTVKDLAIDGNDVLTALGLAADRHGDPRVGPVLQAVLERVLDDPTLGREGQLAAVKAALGSTGNLAVKQRRQ